MWSFTELTQFFEVLFHTRSTIYFTLAREIRPRLSNTSFFLLVRLDRFHQHRTIRDDARLRRFHVVSTHLARVCRDVPPHRHRPVSFFISRDFRTDRYIGFSTCLVASKPIEPVAVNRRKRRSMPFVDALVVGVQPCRCVFFDLIAARSQTIPSILWTDLRRSSTLNALKLCFVHPVDGVLVASD